LVHWGERDLAAPTHRHRDRPGALAERFRGFAGMAFVCPPTRGVIMTAEGADKPAFRGGMIENLFRR